MKRLLPCIIVLMLLMSRAGAQCTDSLIGGGGPASDFSGFAVMDSAQNLYTTGYYDSLATFADTTVLGSTLRYGVFLNKYNDRREFQWLKRIARAKKGFPQPPVIAGAGRHLYIFARTFNDTVAVNGVTYTSPGQPGSRTYFLVHADLNGTITWSRVYRYRDPLTASNGFAMTVAPDTSGTVYISGTFTDTLRIGTTLLGTAGSQVPCVFLAKINSAGTVLWARQSTSSTTAYAYAGHMHFNPRGQIVVGGHYHSAVIFGGNSAGSTPASPVSGAPFLVAYDTAGVFSWINAPSISTARLANSMTSTSDQSGNTYSSGFVYDTVDFGGGNKLIGTNDMYLAKYSSTGALIWAKKKAGHVGMSGTETGTGMIVNHSGRLIVNGVFTDSTYFGGTKYLSNGGQDFFISEYDSTGSLLRVNIYGSAGTDEVGCPILHPNDSVVVSGNFAGPMLMMNGRMRMNNGLSGSDVFWYDRCAKIDSSGPGVGVGNGKLRDLVIYPNPVRDELHIALGQASTAAAVLTVYDIAGRQVFEAVYAPGTATIQLATGNWPGGSYLLRLRQNDVVYRRVVVKE